MKETIKSLHIAAQYLAAAGISFIKKETDDSHTNLGWNTSQGRIETHFFGPENQQLAINLITQHLEWLKEGEKTDSININQHSHQEILDWISVQVSKSGLKEVYKYQFHYDLPYPTLLDSESLIFDIQTLKKIVERFNTGQKAFELFLAKNNLMSPIRIWPHHFDLGIYTRLNSESNLFMGAGLAIPDSLVDDLYYYASAYNNGSAIVTKSFSPLSSGNWRTDWNGATLAASQIDANTASNFLTDSQNEFLNNV